MSMSYSDVPIGGDCTTCGRPPDIGPCERADCPQRMTTDETDPLAPLPSRAEWNLGFQAIAERNVLAALLLEQPDRWSDDSVFRTYSIDLIVEARRRLRALREGA